MSLVIRYLEKAFRWVNAATGRFISAPQTQVIRYIEKSTRWIDVKTGRFVATPREELNFFRLSVAGNFVERHHYFGAIYQQWFVSRDDAEEAIEDSIDHVTEMIENYLDYDRDEWWFDANIGYGIQEDNDFHESYEEIEEH